MTNRKLGNNFEQELCELLFKEGFWVHNLAQNQSGQPADIIAVKEGKAFLIDAKVCSDNKFAKSRIEQNQRLSMGLWRDSKNGTGWFALLICEEIFMVPYLKINETEKTVLTLSDIVDYGMTFEKWLKKCS